MHLRELRIKGWRSFAPDRPLELTLGAINVIVGPNNTGKSNIGRFLEWLANTLEPTLGNDRNLKMPVKTLDRLGLMPTWPYVNARPISPNELWMERAAGFTATIGIDSASLDLDRDLLQSLNPDGKDGDFQVSILCSANRSTAGDNNFHVRFNPIMKTGRTFFGGPENQPAIWHEGDKYQPTTTPGTAHEKLALLLCQQVARGVLRIPAVRHGSVADTSVGARVVAELHRLKGHPDTKQHYGEVIWKLQTWMARLLGRPGLELEVQSRAQGSTADASIGARVKLPREGGPPFVVDLEHMGDGVAQLFYVLAFLRLQPDRKLLLVLDEPESNLHPGAVVELVQLIRQELPHVQLLITSHSTSFMDAADEDWTLFRMDQDDEYRSFVRAVEAKSEQLALLDAIGVRPSQLFLANTVIWVEGPSDIVYLKALLHEAAPDLLPGRDFTFVTFGGASGAWLSAATEGDDSEPPLAPAGKVEMLQVATNNVVIHDLDGDPRNKTQAEVVRRIQEEFAAANVSHVALSTDCLEIENFVRPEVLEEVVRDIVQPTIRDGGSTIAVIYDPVELTDATSFDEVFATAAQRPDGGEISDKKRRGIQSALAGKKHEIARRIAARDGNRFTDTATQFGAKVVNAIRRPGHGG